MRASKIFTLYLIAAVEKYAVSGYNIGRKVLTIFNNSEVFSDD